MTSFSVSSANVSVGRLRPMSNWSAFRRRLVAGSPWSTKAKSAAVRSSGGREHRPEQLPDGDAAGPHGRDLVAGREGGEGVEDRQEHRHRQGHGHDEGQAEEEDLPDDGPGQPLADQRPEPLGDLVQQHDAGQGRHREDERGRQLPEHVPAQQPHGAPWRLNGIFSSAILPRYLSTIASLLPDTRGPSCRCPRVPVAVAARRCVRPGPAGGHRRRRHLQSTAPAAPATAGGAGRLAGRAVPHPGAGGARSGRGSSTPGSRGTGPPGPTPGSWPRCTAPTTCRCSTRAPRSRSGGASSGSRQSTPTSASTARSSWRSAPTGCATSPARRPSCSTRTRDAAAGSRRRGWTTSSTRRSAG